MSPFAELGVATVGEAGGTLLAGPWLRLVPGSRAAGRARTVRCGAGDNLAVHRAFVVIEPGEVVVVSSPDATAALVGELLAVQARARGAAALLVDGAVRDADELAALGLPVWARAVNPSGAAKADPGELDVPLVVGGATVEPGDTVVLDADGALVVAAGSVVDVLEAAQERAAREAELRSRLARGETTLGALGLPR